MTFATTSLPGVHDKGFRSLSLALALFYSGAATELPFRILDLALPAFKLTGGGEFPCAGHDCCCESMADCRDGCCCFPSKVHRGERKPGTERVRVRFISALQCAGLPGPATARPGGPGLSPHLAPALDRGPAPPVAERRAPDDSSRRESTPAEVPQPVPRPEA